MESKNAKHIAVIEAETKSELLRKVNDAIDAYGIDVIHYSIEEQIDLYDNSIWSMEIFFQGPMIFGYELSGEDMIMNEFRPATNKSRGR